MFGSQCGDTRSRPRSSSTFCCSSTWGRPPTALPMITPAREGSISPIPESRAASIAAATPYWTSRPVLRTSFACMASVGSNPFTSAAMLTGYSLASNLVISTTPLCPATRFDQVVGTSFPTGVTAPRPVITARRIEPETGHPRRGLRLSDLPVAEHDVLRRRQLLEPQRPARMQPVRGDADLRAHAVHTAVGEAGGCVHVHGGRVHLPREPLGG